MILPTGWGFGNARFGNGEKLFKFVFPTPI